MENAFEKFCRSIDIEDSQKIIDILSSYGDDKATGNRSAGSKASSNAAMYLSKEFKRIGLKNITIDKFKSSGWTYNGANISYYDKNGNEKKIILGGYATNLQATDLLVKVVDGKKGRIGDYKALGDVTNKLVLISIDPFEDFWVTYPTYQAYLKGAKAVLVVTKYVVEHENYLISQPIEGPAYAPAFAISEKASNILKALIKKSKDKEIVVKLNAQSYVKAKAISYNIWGDIPGKTDEVIYLIAHYDGYYHSYFDDASGVSTILGIAKAIIDSGYKPNKTIRVITHAAEEWGRENSDYDWAVGAYEQITHIHPEWAEKAFALINIDGSFPVVGENNFEIRVSSEVLKYVRNSTKEMIKKGKYNIEVLVNNSTWSEEFAYSKAGIPCITARDPMELSIYYRNIYHSSMDSKAFGFDHKIYWFNHALYGQILFELDNTLIRPMNFYQRFLELKRSIDPIISGKSVINTVKKTSFYAYQLSAKIEKINLEIDKPIIDNCNFSEYNLKLQKLYKKLQDSFVRLNWMGEVVFPHENYQKNVDLLTKAINALKSKEDDLEYIVNEYIKPIDFNRYVFDFDRKCYNFFSNRVTNENMETWGYKLVEKPNEDLYNVAHSLRRKFYDETPEVREEVELLKIALERQESYLDEIVYREICDMQEIIEEMKKII